MSPTPNCLIGLSKGLEVPNRKVYNLLILVLAESVSEVSWENSLCGEKYLSESSPSSYPTLLGVEHRRGPGDDMRRHAAILGAGGVKTRSGGDTGGPFSPDSRCSTAPPRPPLIGRTPRPPQSAIASSAVQESDFRATGTPIKAPEPLKRGAAGNPERAVLDFYVDSAHPQITQDRHTRPEAYDSSEGS